MAKAAKTLTTKAAEKRKAARELTSPRAARRRSLTASCETAHPEVVTTPEPAKDAAESNKAPTGKLAIVVAALSNEAGATIAELVAATGWQAHSVRGAISGSLKKKHGLIVTSEKVDGVRRYRIVTSQAG